MIKRLFFDCETTGTVYKWHAIHQIAGIIDVDGEIKDEFDFKVRPHEKATIDDAALKVSGVTKEIIMAYPEMMDVYGQLIEKLSRFVDKYKKSDKFFLAGFNIAAFDNEFLRAFFWRCGDKFFGSYFWPHPLDVYILASEVLKEVRPTMPEFKLRTVAPMFGIPVDDTKTHNGVYDCRVTRDIYYQINKLILPYQPIGKLNL
jgi:DNA polymerase-3 subunit epsilon